MMLPEEPAFIRSRDAASRASVPNLSICCGVKVFVLLIKPLYVVFIHVSDIYAQSSGLTRFYVSLATLCRARAAEVCTRQNCVLAMFT